MTFCVKVRGVFEGGVEDALGIADIFGLEAFDEEDGTGVITPGSGTADTLAGVFVAFVGLQFRGFNYA